MNRLLVDMIAMYAEHGPRGVHVDKDFLELADRYRGDSALEREHNRVQDVARYLEGVLAGVTHRDQIAFALQAFTRTT